MGYDPYMGSGYRNAEAEERARAVREQALYPNQYKGPPDLPIEPPIGFVAPGFPAEAPVRVPPPPPAIVGGGAGAAAGAAGGAWAVAGGFAIGLGLGFWVKKDIDRFKRTAKLPFYDTLKWEESELAPEPLWGVQEWADDFWTKYRASEAIEDWWATALNPNFPNGWNFRFGNSRLDVNWCRLPISEGGQGQEHPCSTAGPYKFHAGYTIAGHPSSHPQQCTPGSTCSDTDGIFDVDFVATPWEGFAQGLPGTFGNSCAIKQQRTENARWIARGGMSVVPNPGQANIIDPDNWFQEYVQVGTIVQTDVGYGTPETWLDAAAPDGTQPSLAQQSVPGRLPSGRPGNRAGYTVPFSLGHPFTAIRVAPGTSSPVTVPDQVIDPGSETDPGGVTIVPPGHPPGNPPYQYRSRKPGHGLQKMIRGGMIAINAVTETQDFLEALHAGLPKHLRSKGRNGGDVPPWVILEDIWNNWDDWDAEVGLEAFINNQIEDAIYGRFFGLQSRIQRKAGVTAGLGRGVKGYRPTKLVVPEVHFANGKHEITFGEWSIGV